LSWLTRSSSLHTSESKQSSTSNITNLLSDTTPC
jgi:hypothetical protein